MSGLIGMGTLGLPGQLNNGIARAASYSKPLVEPYIVKMWEKVAWCETHGDWKRNMPLFDGGLGISRVVWIEYGGTDFAAAPHLATKVQQIAIARRIQAKAGMPNYIPDQAGECHAW